MMFFAALYMQNVCRCRVSRASTVLQWNIKGPSSVARGLAAAVPLFCCSARGIIPVVLLRLRLIQLFIVWNIDMPRVSQQKKMRT